MIEIGILILVFAAFLAILSYVHDLAKIQHRSEREFHDLRMKVCDLIRSMTREDD